MKNKYIYDFYRFEGDGGGAGEGAPAAGGNGSGLDAQASEFLSSLGFKEDEIPFNSGKKQQNPAPAKKDEGGSSQVGADTKADGGGNNNAVDLNAEFAELIGKEGKYHTQYGEAVAKVIQDRFKNQADLQGQVNQMNEAVAPLMQMFGLEAGDFAGLKERIESDRGIFKAGAEEAGIDVDQYVENLILRADAERGRQIQQEYNQQNARNEMFGRWSAEADALKAALPNFDLNREIHENPDFVDMLNKGLSVKQAFFATHSGDILQNAADDASKKAQAAVMDQIKDRSTRPVEGGINPTAPAQRSFNPANLSDDDIDKALKTALGGGVVQLKR